MQALKKMGPLSGVMSMLPGIPKEVRDVEIDDRQISHVEAIIKSMTPAERIEPDVIDGSRRTRIAKGSGTSPAEVTQLITQFKQMRQMMKEMGKTPRRRKGKKGGGKKAKKGGRVTAKGPAKVNKAAFALPTLEEMESQMPKGGGFPKLT